MIKNMRTSETELVKKVSLQNANAPRGRGLLKAVAGLFAGLAVLSPFHPASAHAAETGEPKVLIVYFSHSGNTRAIANQIHDRVGGDILELKTTHAYPDEYRPTTEQAKRELNEGFRPELANDIESVASYDVVFIGYPTWWGTMPTALFTFLEKHDLSGKRIVPFCTHGGSGFGRGREDIAKLCPKSEMLEGLAVRGSRASDAREDVGEWLREIGMIK